LDVLHLCDFLVLLFECRELGVLLWLNPINAV
jgi:hypothetical protein